MTYRHYDCVYCEYLGDNKCKCLKKNKEFKFIDWVKPHCNKLILKPQLLLSHIIKNKDKTLEWIEADKISKNYLDKYGFAGMIFNE